MYYIQPKYIDNFTCLGGSCPETCCAGWSVDWSAEEVRRLCGRLRDAESCFDKRGGRYAVKMNTQGECPFLNDERLCSVQKALGEEYLSFTCREYPRISRQCGNSFIRVCKTSCVRVVSMLCKGADITLTKCPVTEENVMSVITAAEEISRCPELSQLDKIVYIIFEELSDSTKPIDVCIRSAKQKAKLLTENIRNITAKPYSDISFDTTIKILMDIYGCEPFGVIADDALYYNKYKEGMKKLSAYPNYQQVIRSIAINLYLESVIYNFSSQYSLYENFSYFEFCFSSLILAAASVGYASDDIDSDLPHFISCVMKIICADSGLVAEVIKYLSV